VVIFLLRKREMHHELRTFAHHTARLHGVVIGDDAVYWAQTQPRTALRVPRGIKWIENMLDLLGRNADAIIADGNAGIRPLR
jgi:hypothetical protein